MVSDYMLTILATVQTETSKSIIAVTSFVYRLKNKKIKKSINKKNVKNFLKRLILQSLLKVMLSIRA